MAQKTKEEFEVRLEETLKKDATITCKFLIESEFITKTTRGSFARDIIHYDVTRPKINTEFKVEKYTELEYSFDIIVMNSMKYFCDGGTKIEIINVPKNMVELTNQDEESKELI